MPAKIDNQALQTIFALPKPDGEIEEPFRRYLRSVGARRTILLLAFAPKAGGTYFRQAAMYAVKGRIIRFCHAQGGRDGTPYLPTILGCCLDDSGSGVVSHMHMQALPANRHLMHAFGIKPVMMLRNLPDMLVSFLDMLETDQIARAEGLNCLIPDDFTDFEHGRKRDFMIDIIAPWYVSYFASWKRYADEEPKAVCILRYEDFCAAPAQSLQKALDHAGFSVPLEQCQDAVARTWSERDKHRYNKGTSGRGAVNFSPDQFERLSRQLSNYTHLRPWLPELMGEAASKEWEHAGEALALAS